MADVERRDVRPRPPVAFTTPGDLLRFGPLPPFDRVRMGAAVLALQRFANDRAPYERAYK